MLQYHTFKPSKSLENLVRFYWMLESDQPYTHFSMADVCPELIFHFKGRFNEIFENGKSEKSFTAGFHGQTSLTRKFHIDSSFGIFGIYLFPTAIPALFGIASKEITNQMVSLNELLKHEGDELEGRIASATDYRSRIKILEDFFEYRLKKQEREELPLTKCIQVIIEKKDPVTVKQLVDTQCLSERQLERQFLRLTGLSPKLFSRIVRFQSAMVQYGSKDKSLTSIALESGYYDQSHFIHDFKKFSGHLPKEIFSGDSQATAWRD